MIRPSNAGSTSSKLRAGAIAFAAYVAAVALEIAAFTLTRSRLGELAVGIPAAIAIGTIVLPNVFATAGAPVASQASSYRTSAVMQLVLAGVFAIDLVLQVMSKTVGFSRLHEFDIAIFMLMVATSPFSYFLMRRRYLIAKAARDAGPPDRWSVYKQKLAGTDESTQV